MTATIISPEQEQQAETSEHFTQERKPQEEQAETRYSCALCKNEMKTGKFPVCADCAF